MTRTELNIENAWQAWLLGQITQDDLHRILAEQTRALLMESAALLVKCRAELAVGTAEVGR